MTDVTRGNHDILECEAKKICSKCGAIRWHRYHWQDWEDFNQPEDCPND